MRRGKGFVYVNESGFAPGVSRLYADARKGQRVYGLICGKKRPRTSLIAARIRDCFEELLLFEGTCNADIFNLWLEQQLCPKLGGNHVVVMGNASFHKGRRTQELIEKTGVTLLFLPPYSPDLNPIEHDRLVMSLAALKKRREYNEHLTIDEISKHI